MVRLISCFAVVLIAIGCTQPVGGLKKPPLPPAKVASLEQACFESFQDRDAVRAAKLRALKGQKIKYDKKRQEAIESVGAEASRETWKAKAAKALAERLDKVPQEDDAAFDAVLEEIARGSERAAK